MRHPKGLFFLDDDLPPGYTRDDRGRICHPDGYVCGISGDTRRKYLVGPLPHVDPLTGAWRPLWITKKEARRGGVQFAQGFSLKRLARVIARVKGWR